MSTIEKKAIVDAKLGSVLYDITELELEDLDRTDTFKELGIDSYITLRFSRALEQEFQVTISYKQLVTEIIHLDGLSHFLLTNAPDYLFTHSV